jgi:hypothetical protein
MIKMNLNFTDMMQDKILYTDGHDVTVTDSMFYVRNMSYRLIGITKHGLHIVRPHRLPGFVLVLMGVVLLVSGVLNLMPENFIPSVEVLGVTFSGNTILMGSGAAIILVGVLIVGLLRERYAVRIATAEGEKDVVVSNQKEYVNQIINALNRAFNFVRVKK